MAKPEDVLRRLADGDLDWLVRARLKRRTDYEAVKQWIRDKPDVIDVMLDDPELADGLFAERHVLLSVSPLLFFAVLIRRAHHDLKASRFTLEEAEEGQLPVFDAPQAAALLDDAGVRLYLVEMLASFTRTESVAVVVRGRRGWVRRAYSDLRVDDLIELSERVDEPYRLPFLHRAADACLFITGMFPRHVVKGQTMRREGVDRSLEDYESLGKEFYQRASELSGGGEAGRPRVWRSLADAFSLARKPLSLIAQRYIPFEWREWEEPQWHMSS